MTNKMVSDIISKDDIKKWDNGSIVTIKAGTGVGKSYFIKNTLYEYAKENNKKILMLLHRVNCLQQFKGELIEDDKLDIINIRTYQSIEALQSKGIDFNFAKYDYIVCDEFHYFMSDASFNKTTDISLNTILNQTKKIRIFMSATGFYMKNYISNIKKLNTTDYDVDINYDFIEQLEFFNTDGTLELLINNIIKNKEKAIIFIQSATKAYELHEKYSKYSMFNCSESDKHYSKVDNDKKESLLINERFEESLLITTTALDAGVNIIDRDLKHIIVDVDNVGSLTQCIGRKRVRWLDKETGEWVSEKVNVYIKNISNQRLGGKLKHINERLEKAIYLRNNTLQEYIQKYGRDGDSSNIVYDDYSIENNEAIKKVNELMYFKSLIDRENIKKMLKKGKGGYMKFISEEFNKEDGLLIEDTMEIETMQGLLEDMVGKKLYKDDQKVLIDIIDFRVDSKQQKSYRKLNYALDEVLRLPYVILPKRTNSKTYWIIEKIDK